VRTDQLEASHLVMADGPLPVKEIYFLELGKRGTRLAVLSACQTFLGQENPQGPQGVEILGLADAFAKAGAATVVSSLWNVSDRATTELMVGFYQGMKSQNKAEALRAAQLALLRSADWSHPYYWSAFILMGEWR
jgi:CHAT domain-containing protein